MVFWVFLKHYQGILEFWYYGNRSRQLTLEFDKIDQQYKKKNTQHDWGLTSWNIPDDMFPWGDPLTTTTTIGHTIFDWAQLNWDYENATSSHSLANPLQPAQKLWIVLVKFIFDGTICCICFNGFGPEEGYSLGTCKHMYHPICLITHILIQQRCCQCKASFHERLYKLFGLCPYMPPSWEHNPENTPEMPYNWGEDLVWNWKMDAHFLNKLVFNFAMGWENDHEEIVRVAKSIIKRNFQAAKGMRNFFYQCFKGYWDSANKRFQFGVHPQGLIWNDNG